jgi:excisionase family DNA binding protein
MLNAIRRYEGSIMEGSNRPIFITIKDAANMLGLSEDTVHHLKGGTHKLTRVRFGRSVRMIRQEIEAHIEQRIKASQLGSNN